MLLGFREFRLRP